MRLFRNNGCKYDFSLIMQLFISYKDSFLRDCYALNQCISVGCAHVSWSNLVRVRMRAEGFSGWLLRPSKLSQTHHTKTVIK